MDGPPPRTPRPRAGLLAGLAEDDWSALAALGRRKRFAARQTIFHKGDPGEAMLLILSGCARISIASEDGREATLNFVEPGEMLGEIAVLDGRPRSADAVAAAPVEALVIDRAALRLTMEERPGVAAAVIEVLCARLRRSSWQVEAMALRDLPGRLALLLIGLAEERGAAPSADDPEALRIPRPPSQGDMARLIGASREGVNRQLRAWARAGLIACPKGAIVLRDPAALRALAR
ncbi:MAG: Crp/Fnr family transcriptional regulator [Rubrimonas sp.]|uniref:Crp/Fnr family transcriptional regulator n=1 Tax=Rubrimonas sp. TaxID=2036015 RepID=UPI002FDCD563